MTRHRLARPLHRYLASALLLPLGWSPADAQTADSARTDSIRARAGALGVMVVSATRTAQALRTLPQHVVVIGRDAIEAAPTQTAVDLLRGVPGFTTRDFSSGLQMGPSQSIVAFRGLGGSSAGRTLVLLDDIPVGDPFSGWFDWARLPLPLIESVEVVRGGGSAIWGSRSLGGIVNLRTVAPPRDEARLLLEGGAYGTAHAAGTATLRRGPVSATLAADGWTTGGIIPIRADQVGPVDRRIARRSRTALGKVTWEVTPTLRLWSSGSRFGATEAATVGGDSEDVTDVRGGARWARRSGSVGSVTLFGQRRRTDNNSFTVNSARTTETPNRSQDTDADGGGVSAQWTQLVAGRHQVTVGSDISWASGSLRDAHAWQAAAFTRQRVMVGRQVITGVFLQDAVPLFGDALQLLGSLRVDRVQEGERTRAVRTLPSLAALSDTSYGAQTRSRVTGSLGVRGQVTSWLAWRSTAYEAFRAPTLYEQLYPRYSNRGTITESNPALAAEVLRGAELGADLTLGTTLLVRVTGYTNRVRSPVLDITVGQAGSSAAVIAPCGPVPAQQACAQRRNVEALVSRGVETEIAWTPHPAWRLTAGNSYVATRIVAGGEPVDGREAVRAPRHMVTGAVQATIPRMVTLSLEARHVSRRFDNDLNTITLGDFTLVHLRASRQLRRGMTLHLTGENLLDRQYEITRTGAGLAEVGAPRWVTAGVRAAW